MQDAVDYYDAISSELGDVFLDEVERALERIVNFPKAWPRLFSRIRRCRLVGFTYSIVYQNRSDRFLVVAVMHLQRKPND